MINTHMSKFRKIVVIMAVLMGVVSASAALPFDKYSINRKDLPDAAKEMLDEYFPKAKVSMIKVDKHLLKKTDYDVKLTNGTKSVPESLVPKAIRNSVVKRYDGEKIVRISRSSLYYTVGLSNGKDLKYDRLGIFQCELTPKEAEEFGTEALAEADSLPADGE